MTKRDKMKTGEKLTKHITEKVTLRLFKTGCDETNFEILKEVPSTTNLLLEKTKLSKMPLNKRLNALEKAGLLKRNKREGLVETTKLTKAFLKIIKDIQKDVISEMVNLI